MLILQITPPYAPWNLPLAKKLLVNDKITASCSTNILPKRHIKLYKQQKLTLKNGKARGVTSFSTSCLPRSKASQVWKTEIATAQAINEYLAMDHGNVWRGRKGPGYGEQEKCLSHDT